GWPQQRPQAGPCTKVSMCRRGGCRPCLRAGVGRPTQLSFTRRLMRRNQDGTRCANDDASQRKGIPHMLTIPLLPRPTRWMVPAFAASGTRSNPRSRTEVAPHGAMPGEFSSDAAAKMARRLFDDAVYTDAARAERDRLRRYPSGDAGETLRRSVGCGRAVGRWQEDLSPCRRGRWSLHGIDRSTLGTVTSRPTGGGRALCRLGAHLAKPSPLVGKPHPPTPADPL